MILLALFTIALAVALPKMAIEVQHDRDQETMERGRQYVRAIQLYYRKFNAYPPNLDALVKTNDIRFLRKKYIDPTTGKADWKPIAMCQNKTPIAMGFFGQPLGPPGCGPGMGAGVMGGLPGSPGSPGQGAPGAPGTGSIFDNSGNSGSSSIFSNPTQGGQPNGGAPGAPGAPGTPTAGAPGAGTGDQSGTGGTDNPTGGMGPTMGQAFGGAVIGVSPASPKKSLYVYKKKDHYNQWEFLYSPLSDMQQMGGGGMTGGQPGMGQPGMGQPGMGQPGGPFGGQPGGPGSFGPGGNGGSNPIQPPTTPPPTPQ